jgi:hypothetical protein
MLFHVLLLALPIAVCRLEIHGVDCYRLGIVNFAPPSITSIGPSCWSTGPSCASKAFSLS